jgi:hypothetical protein
MRTCQFSRASRASSHSAILKRAASIARRGGASLTLAGLAACSASTSPNSTATIGAVSSARRMPAAGFAVQVAKGDAHVGASIV